MPAIYDMSDAAIEAACEAQRDQLFPYEPADEPGARLPGLPDGDGLTLPERHIACGCIATFILHLGRDLRRGDLTAAGQASYLDDLRTARAALAKLTGGLSHG